jgi:hypothetical protein
LSILTDNEDGSKHIRKKIMIILLSLIFYLYFARATDMKDKSKITYGIDFKVECPLCKEMIPVGYAGPIGLAQHQGRKKCMATCERKQKEKKKGKIRTLFEVGVKKTSDIASSSTTTPLPSSINHHIPPIIVHPTDVLNRDHSHSEDLLVLHPHENTGTSRRQGCNFALDLLRQLKDAERTMGSNIPVGQQGDEIAAYGKVSAMAQCLNIPNDEVWEVVNPGLDRLLGFGRALDDIQSIVRRGPLGVLGLLEYLTYLVEEKGVDGGLIEGKINVLIDAINK